MFRAPSSTIQRVYAMFGYPSVVFEEVMSGYRTTLYAATAPSGQRLNLLVHKNEPGAVARIRRTLDIERELGAAGFPVREHIDQRILRLSTTKSAYHATLCSYLPGETIPWEAYTMKHIKLLGWALAEQHRAMQSLDTAEYPNVYDEYLSHLATMQDYFARSGVRNALQMKLGLRIDPEIFVRMQRYLKEAKELPGQQLLHMDFVRGNVLFSDGSNISRFKIGDVTLCGIIDFEKAAVGHVAFDMARTLAFLLADCSGKSEEQIYRYFIDSGYKKRGYGVLPPAAELEKAIGLHLLHDLYAFLLHNPFESLADNYHYCRTRDILLERKMVQLS